MKQKVSMKGGQKVSGSRGINPAADGRKGSGEPRHESSSVE